MKNQVADIPGHAVITHFKSGLHDEKLLDKLSRKPPTNVESLFDVANKYANAQEETTDILLRNLGKHDRPRDYKRDDSDRQDDRREDRRDDRRGGRRGNDRQNRNWERKHNLNDDVNVVDYDNKRNRITIEDALDKQCPMHSEHKHLYRDCRQLKYLLRRGTMPPPRRPGGRGDEENPRKDRDHRDNNNDC